MAETRRPSDRHAVSREDIERELRRQRDTLPPPIAAALIEAQLGDEVEACPVCGCGIIPAALADRARGLLPPIPDDTPTGVLPTEKMGSR